ncbi:Uncharacterized membrane protein YdjX, TVP38/TMEM64 family, SNARE-associated domain [Butyrivibrio hungatei DSM 14810]|uniref:TVP38/TMEM64 family membrane protein n=2 Tax=Butyrivibrio hungatei TaxID=185008 RepID=A0A1D9P291_9FIRM|nr:VTT domain-containing protein [Butyrivibrio hungatei]AOZ96612.1 hypothetical protein bhn_I1579 [Butyrivibrio hungatei]SHN55707.1 Uncharacterized membrane protein YdjX, TVP38/TMEM64 family, SNARE-associated domain [Butyrivibrio hungatei DSM 14810]
MKKGVFRTILTIALVVVFMLSLYLFIGRPMIKFVGDPDKLKQYVAEQGVLGLLIFGIFIFIQTLSTCIPGLPFYLAAGYVWGGLKGAVICDVFATLANSLAFLIGRRFGRDFLLYLFPEDKLIKVEDFIKRGKPMLIHILFMLFPLPKDTYAYLGYYSEEKLIVWIILTLIFRFPHIFLYTYSGAMLISNQYSFLVLGAVIAIIVYVVAALFVKKEKEGNSRKNN